LETATFRKPTMNSIETTLNHIQKHPIIPVYYHDDVNTCISMVRACYNGGIRIFEFTNRGTKAMNTFKKLVDYRNKYLPGLYLGIGTIMTPELALEYLQSGADFIVSPIVNPGIAEVTLKRNILWIPGCMTPTEISIAENAGAPLIKLFPGSIVGPDFLKNIKPLFPSLLFMPTGGIGFEKESLNAWFSKGAIAIGLGSNLFQAPTDSSTTDNYDWLTRRCQEISLFAPSN